MTNFNKFTLLNFDFLWHEIYNGNLLLVHQDLVFKFFGAEQSDEHLSEEIFMEEEIEEMKESGMSDDEVEEMIKFEASYRVPNRLTERYLGEPVLERDTEKVKLTKYAL